MLRASNEALQLDVDITSVVDGSTPSVEYGAELSALATALTTNTNAEPRSERNALVSVAGPAVAERAVGVCATFQMMNRLLDGVGAPVNPALHPLQPTSALTQPNCLAKPEQI